MRKQIKNLIIVILMVLISVNFIFPSFTYAQDSEDSETKEAEESNKNNFGTTFSGMLDAVMGFLLYPWKLFFIVPGIIINVILSAIASVGGGEVSTVTLETILFNNLPLTDINIFSLETTANGVTVSETIKNIREEVANWYYAFRNLAIVFSLLMLTYTGIRMAISNIAEKKANYKQMLFNWIISLGLVLIMHYLIIFVINANTALVNILNPSENNGSGYMDSLLEIAFSIPLAQSWGATIMYSILQVITLIFLMVYIKRMLMICFLIIIAPIVAVTYSVDKSGNRKSEILNSWLKEFCYNVLLQPFHCITYLIFVGTAMNLLYKSEPFNFGTTIFAIVCILCIFTGEKMIRLIFGFGKSKSVADKIFKGSMITSAVNNVKTLKESKEEEEEPEPPAVMPDGTDTEEELSKYNNNGKLKEPKQEETAETAENSNTKSKRKNTKGKKQEAHNKKTTKTKASSKQGKLETTIKNIGKTHTRGALSGAGYDNYKHRHEGARREKMPHIQEQFMMASNKYRKSVNPAMTDRQLARQMEIIMKTPMNDLKTPEDVLYKSWIDYTRASLTSKGSKNSLEDMREMIKNNEEYTKL